MARLFNGTSDSIVSNNSFIYGGVTAVTLAFWLWQDSYSNSGDYAIVSSPNFDNNTGAFVIAPDSVTESGLFQMSWTDGTFKYFHTTIPRPSAAAWHAYVIVISALGTAGFKAWVDGVSQTVTSQLANATPGTINNENIYLMSRGGSLLFNAGRMANVAVWAADESANAAAIYSAMLAGTNLNNIDSANCLAYTLLAGTASPEPDVVNVEINNWVLTGTSFTPGPLVTTFSQDDGYVEFQTVGW